MCARSVTENFNCEEYEPGGLLGQYDYVKCVKMSLEREAYSFFDPIGSLPLTLLVMGNAGGILSTVRG